jgi:outer membrane lipoprotein-sorting protein
MKWLFTITMCLALSTLSGAAGAQERARPTAEQLLERMDGNLTFDTRRARMVMRVEGRRTRTYEMVSYGRGQHDAAIEYLSPARDRGTKMLKLGDELWLYLPGAGRVQKISGHMLRQGMMGSDVSYEDLMSSQELRAQYTSRVTGESSHGGRPCWTLEMRAKDDTVTYPRRVICVDKETFIPLEQKLYALSGMLLKTWTMSDVEEFEGGRRFPTTMTVQDHVRKGSITRIQLTELVFGIDHPREIFSLRWLERR